jgi:hypothetical protein
VDKAVAIQQHPQRIANPLCYKHENLFLVEEFAEKATGERARLFWLGVVDRLRENRLVRELPASRNGFLLLFCEELLKKCIQWTIEHIVLHCVAMEKLIVWDTWRYLAATLLSNTTGLSLEKTK